MTTEGYTISVERDGPTIKIHATKGATVYTASYCGGPNNRARDHAITTLIEQICGFSRNHILIALYELEKTK